MSIERWKPALWKSIQTPYQVSSFGRIRNVKTGHIKSQMTNRKGYRYVIWRVWDKESKKHYSRHIPIATCVATAFKRPKKRHEQVEHLNQLKADNRNCNLRWMSQSQNVKRSWKLTARRLGHAGRLSADAYDLIRRLWAAGRWSQVRIGAATGVTSSNISKIVNGAVKCRDGSRDLDCDWSMLGLDGPI